MRLTRRAASSRDRVSPSGNAICAQSSGVITWHPSLALHGRICQAHRSVVRCVCRGVSPPPRSSPPPLVVCPRHRLGTRTRLRQQAFRPTSSPSSTRLPTTCRALSPNAREQRVSGGEDARPQENILLRVTKLGVKSAPLLGDGPTSAAPSRTPSLTPSPTAPPHWGSRRPWDAHRSRLPARGLVTGDGAHHAERRWRSEGRR